METNAPINKALEEQVNNHTIVTNKSLVIRWNNEEAEQLLPAFIMCGILMLVGTMGNSLVVYVYWRRIQFSAKRIFIMTLAILDLSVCLVIIPFEVYDLRYPILFQDDNICKVMRMLEYFTVLSAGFVLLSVSFERYFYLCQAFAELSERKAKFISIACVVIAGVFSVPSAILAGSKPRHDHNKNLTGWECSMNTEYSKNETLVKIYYCVLLVLFVGCLLIFVVIYTMIGHLLWKYHTGKLSMDVTQLHRYLKEANKNDMSPELAVSNSEILSALNKHTLRDSDTHHKNRITVSGSIIVFFSVTVVFVVSFLPHIVVRYLKSSSVEINKLTYNMLVRSYLISNVTNPFIYSILNRSFKRELKKTLQLIHCNVWRTSIASN